MRKIVQRAANIALVVGGFFVVFFGVQKITPAPSYSGSRDTDLFGQSNADVAFADAPGCGTASDSTASSGGDGSDSGSGGDSSGGK